MKEEVEVLIEPIIKQGKLSFLRKHLVHSKNSKIFFKITTNKDVKNLKLFHLQLWTNKYKRIMKAIIIKDLKANKSAKTESITINFPIPGLYWIRW